MFKKSYLVRVNSKYSLIVGDGGALARVKFVFQPVSRRRLHTFTGVKHVRVSG